MADTLMCLEWSNIYKYMILWSNFTFWSNYFIMNERSNGQGQWFWAGTVMWCWFLGFGQQKHIISGSVTEKLVKHVMNKLSASVPRWTVQCCFELHCFIITSCQTIYHVKDSSLLIQPLLCIKVISPSIIVISFMNLLWIQTLIMKQGWNLMAFQVQSINKLKTEAEHTSAEQGLRLFYTIPFLFSCKSHSSWLESTCLFVTPACLPLLAPPHSADVSWATGVFNP